MSEAQSPAIFIDRDGTLIEEVDYLANPQGVVLIPGAARALVALREGGYKLVLVTNQSGIARGMFDEETLRKIHAFLQSTLAEHGASLDGLYHCPHHPDFGSPPCSCRKPAPGMIMQAAQDLNLDLERSWMIGDAVRDTDAGRAAGTRTLLVRTGKGASQERTWREAGVEYSEPTDSIVTAALQILGLPMEMEQEWIA